MEKARLRALTHVPKNFQCQKFIRRNGESPTKGIDTLLIQSHRLFNFQVEMEKARLRALTQDAISLFNDSKSVEMEKARLRALTLF